MVPPPKPMASGTLVRDTAYGPVVSRPAAVGAGPRSYALAAVALEAPATRLAAATPASATHVATALRLFNNRPRSGRVSVVLMWWFLLFSPPTPTRRRGVSGGGSRSPRRNER